MILYRVQPTPEAQRGCHPGDLQMVGGDQNHSGNRELRARLALVAVDAKGVHHHLQRGPLVSVDERVEVDDEESRSRDLLEKTRVRVLAADGLKRLVKGGLQQAHTVAPQPTSTTADLDGLFVQRKNRRHGWVFLTLVATVEFVLGHLLHLSEQLQRFFVLTRDLLHDLHRVGVCELFPLSGAHGLRLFHDALRHSGSLPPAQASYHRGGERLVRSA